MCITHYQFALAGFAKSASYWYRSLWLAAVDDNDAGRPPLPPLHVVRISQTWDTHPPAPNVSHTRTTTTVSVPPVVDVQVFSDLPHIELILNGKLLGAAPCRPGAFASFSGVPFTGGNLTAVGRMAAGRAVLASHTQVAAGAPAAIELTVDVPSAATGTGSCLVLDGHDAGK